MQACFENNIIFKREKITIFEGDFLPYSVCNIFAFLTVFNKKNFFKTFLFTFGSCGAILYENNL